MSGAVLGGLLLGPFGAILGGQFGANIGQDAKAARQAEEALQKPQYRQKEATEEKRRDLEDKGMRIAEEGDYGEKDADKAKEEQRQQRGK